MRRAPQPRSSAQKYSGQLFSTGMSTGSGPGAAAAAATPDWATSKGWVTPQDAIWAVIGGLDSVMRTSEQMANRVPLLEHAALSLARPAHFANQDTTSCMLCHGVCPPNSATTPAPPPAAFWTVFRSRILALPPLAPGCLHVASLPFIVVCSVDMGPADS